MELIPHQEEVQKRNTEASASKRVKRILGVAVLSIGSLFGQTGCQVDHKSAAMTHQSPEIEFKNLSSRLLRFRSRFKKRDQDAEAIAQLQAMITRNAGLPDNVHLHFYDRIGSLNQNFDREAPCIAGQLWISGKEGGAMPFWYDVEKGAIEINGKNVEKKDIESFLKYTETEEGPESTVLMRGTIDNMEIQVLRMDNPSSENTGEGTRLLQNKLKILIGEPGNLKQGRVTYADMFRDGGSISIYFLEPGSEGSIPEKESHIFIPAKRAAKPALLNGKEIKIEE